LLLQTVDKVIQPIHADRIEVHCIGLVLSFCKLEYIRSGPFRIQLMEPHHVYPCFCQSFGHFFTVLMGRKICPAVEVGTQNFASVPSSKTNLSPSTFRKPCFPAGISFSYKKDRSTGISSHGKVYGIVLIIVSPCNTAFGLVFRESKAISGRTRHIMKNIETDVLNRVIIRCQMFSMNTILIFRSWFNVLYYLSEVYIHINDEQVPLYLSKFHFSKL